VRAWLTPAPDPAFDTKCADICAIYHAAETAAMAGVRTVSLDEMTGVQALERSAPGLPLRPGAVERREFEYIRHGTQTLIAGFDVATGQVFGQIGDHRCESDFAAFLEGMLDGAAPDVQWEIVADNLNIHLSESVVRIVARRCGVTQDLGQKQKHGILTRRAAQLNRAPAGKPSCAMPIIASASILRPSTPPGSTRSNSGSPFSPARFCAADHSPQPRTSRTRSTASSPTSMKPSQSHSSGP
jgi:hypothetical protein